MPNVRKAQNKIIGRPENHNCSIKNVDLVQISNRIKKLYKVQNHENSGKNKKK